MEYDQLAHFMGGRVATKDRDWPGFTQWYCCPDCHRLWAYQGEEVVALDTEFALGPATPSDGVPSRLCVACQGEQSAPVAEI